MRIGELAKKVTTPVQTVRFYERQGLLPAPDRSDGNYRCYTASHLDTLLFIRRCRGLDMGLDEIRQLLRLRDDPQVNCGEVNDLIDEHINHVSLRIKELRSLERQLRELRSRCSIAQSTEVCGILQGLSAGQGSEDAQGRGAIRHVHGAHGRL